MRRPRFLAPRFDPAEGSWLVVVYSPLVSGQWHRTRRWYRSARDAWQFIMNACTELRGEVTA